MWLLVLKNVKPVNDWIMHNIRILDCGMTSGAKTFILLTVVVRPIFCPKNYFAN